MGLKYKVNENFFSKWSPNMAYLLGYIYADGNLIDSPKMRGKYLTLTSADKDARQRIKGWLGSEHTIKMTKPYFTGSNGCFVLRIGSHKIYDDLFRIGLYPNKSLTIDFPKIPKKYLGHFTRGYFDGDGCIYFERKKGATNRLIIKRIRIIFTSGSKIFLENMKEELKKLNASNGRIYSSKRSYQLVYNNEDSIKMFKIMYKKAGINSFFMRKFKIFEDYFKLRPSRTDGEISKIIITHIGHVEK